MFFSPENKPIFTPNIPFGAPLRFSTQNKELIFLYLGTISQDQSSTDEVLAIHDWSTGWDKSNENSQFITTFIKNNNITSLIEVNDTKIHRTSTNPRHPLYVLSDTNDILTLINKFQETSELPTYLTDFKEKLTIALKLKY